MCTLKYVYKKLCIILTVTMLTFSFPMMASATKHMVPALHMSHMVVTHHLINNHINSKTGNSLVNSVNMEPDVASGITSQKENPFLDGSIPDNHKEKAVFIFPDFLIIHGKKTEIQFQDLKAYNAGDYMEFFAEYENSSDAAISFYCDRRYVARCDNLKAGKYLLKFKIKTADYIGPCEIYFLAANHDAGHFKYSWFADPNPRE